MRGFSLVEALIASGIAGIAILSTLSLLAFSRLHNEIEQERSRAHQIVSELLEVETYKLFTWTQTHTETTIWNNGTPDDTTDDTVGTVEIVIRDAQDGTVLSSIPLPARMVEIEATITWKHRGSKIPNKTLHETVMTYKSP